MKARMKLATILMTLTTLAQQEVARIRWEGVFSPLGGWKRIHHRSQKKKRILARRRNQ